LGRVGVPPLKHSQKAFPFRLGLKVFRSTSSGRIAGPYATTPRDLFSSFLLPLGVWILFPCIIRKALPSKDPRVPCLSGFHLPVLNCNVPFPIPHTLLFHPLPIIDEWELAVCVLESPLLSSLFPPPEIPSTAVFRTICAEGLSPLFSVVISVPFPRCKSDCPTHLSSGPYLPLLPFQS